MDELVIKASEKFHKVIDVVSGDLATIRTGKASPSLVENLLAEAYGAKMKLIELATINAPDANTLVVTPFDQGNTEAIVKGIQESGLGVTVIPEDTKIRVIVPALSQERREEYVRLAKTKVEGGKVMLRQERHEAMEEIAKSDLDEDSKARLEKEIQLKVDNMVAELDVMAKNKESELLTL